MPIITTLAKKGGVGRTSTTFNLAGAYAETGCRTLLIDLDGQASLTRAILGAVEAGRLEANETMAAVFVGDDTSKVIHDTGIANLSIAPSSKAIQRFASPVESDFDEHIGAMREFIIEESKGFQLILIDTPPQTDVSTVWAALSLSDYVISPVVPTSFGAQSISDVIQLIQAVKARSNPTLRLLGYVLSMVERNKDSETYATGCREIYGGQVFETEIPRAVAYRKAIGEGRPITAYRGKNAEAYRSLAQEIFNRHGSLQQRKAA